jgi:hypothetical protein
MVRFWRGGVYSETGKENFPKRFVVGSFLMAGRANWVARPNFFQEGPHPDERTG